MANNNQTAKPVDQPRLSVTREGDHPMLVIGGTFYAGVGSRTDYISAEEATLRTWWGYFTRGIKQKANLLLATTTADIRSNLNRELRPQVKEIFRNHGKRPAFMVGAYLVQLDYGNEEVEGVGVVTGATRGRSTKPQHLTVYVDGRKPWTAFGGGSRAFVEEFDELFEKGRLMAMLVQEILKHEQGQETSMTVKPLSKEELAAAQRGAIAANYDDITEFMV